MFKGRKQVLIGEKEGTSFPLPIRVIHQKIEALSNVTADTTTPPVTTAITREPVKDYSKEAYSWHLRLGYIGSEKLKLMVNNNLVIGLDKSAIGKFFCDGCQLSRISKKPYSSPSKRETTPGASIHSDVCGLIPVPSRSGSRYFITFKCEATAFRRVFIMKEKSETLARLKDFVTEVKSTTLGKSKDFTVTTEVSLLVKTSRDSSVRRNTFSTNTFLQSSNEWISGEGERDPHGTCKSDDDDCEPSREAMCRNCGNCSSCYESSPQ
jgi:hypothetical protein